MPVPGALGRILANVLPGALMRFAGRLRFPQLFLVLLILLVADLLIPDFIPLLDELLLGIVTLLLASWKRRRDDSGAPPK